MRRKSFFARTNSPRRLEEVSQDNKNARFNKTGIN